MKKKITLNELLDEYVAIYGSSRWSVQAYRNNTGLIRNYIQNSIGKKQMSELNVRDIEKYYQTLLTQAPVRPSSKRPFVTASTIEKIHKLLCTATQQAIRWGYCTDNPFRNSMVPKTTPIKRDIWTVEQFFEAASMCSDDDLLLAMHLAFACTLRLGEILGLTWSNINISSEALNKGTASLYVDKQIQRVNKEGIGKVLRNDLFFIFPHSDISSTALVLKTPKTASSVRKVFLPKTVVAMLQKQKDRIEDDKLHQGNNYNDYDLVFSKSNGDPIEPKDIEKKFNRLIQINGLKRVVFHSLRHTSITYKLVSTSGDIKAVQGDSGHSTANMILDVYSHIIDEGRAKNADLIENDYYKNHNIVFQNQPIKSKIENDINAIDLDKIESILKSDRLETIIELLSRLA